MKRINSSDVIIASVTQRGRNVANQGWVTELSLMFGTTVARKTGAHQLSLF